jgi:hypothetical protein
MFTCICIYVLIVGICFTIIGATITITAWNSQPTTALTYTDIVWDGTYELAQGDEEYILRIAKSAAHAHRIAYICERVELATRQHYITLLTRQQQRALPTTPHHRIPMVHTMDMGA